MPRSSQRVALPGRCRELATGLAISRQAGSRSSYKLTVPLPYTVAIWATVGALLLMLHCPFFGPLL